MAEVIVMGLVVVVVVVVLVVGVIVVAVYSDSDIGGDGFTWHV